MHRIDSSGSVAGLYSPGNPATGQRATLIDADHLNAIQEELCAVIEDAGLDLEKGTNDQLLAAIQALIAGASPGAGYVLETDATKFGSDANGYWEKRPNGVIEQWGKVTGTLSQGAVSHTFPEPFTDGASVNVMVIALNASSGTGTSSDFFAQIISASDTGFSAMIQYADTGSGCSGYMWRAIGK